MFSIFICNLFLYFHTHLKDNLFSLAHLKLVLSEYSPELVCFGTAEFHGIWESLVYESGVKTQVQTKTKHC